MGIPQAYSLTDVGTRPYPSQYELRKCGKIVTLISTGFWFNNPTANTNYEIATIPSELVSGLSHNVLVTSLMTSATGTAVGYARWWVDYQNGKIIVKTNTTVSGACGVSGVATWILP